MRFYLLRIAPMDEATPAPSYLLRTAGGRHILIDTGLSPELATAAREPGCQGSTIRDYVSVVDQLTALGVRPDDIDTLVATPLDPDHVGRTDALQADPETRERPQAARSGGA